MPNTQLPAHHAVEPGTLRVRPAVRAGLAALAALAGLATLTVSSAARARSQSVAPCPAAGLLAWLDTNGNGAAGTIFYTLHLTNFSGHRCTVRGYPRVSAANLSGHRIGPGASRSGLPVHTVILSRGATASANLGIVQAGNFPPALCGPTTAAGLRVSAPNATPARFVPFPFAACTHRSNLRISPLTAP